MSAAQNMDGEVAEQMLVEDIDADIRALDSPAPDTVCAAHTPIARSQRTLLRVAKHQILYRRAAPGHGTMAAWASGIGAALVALRELIAYLVNSTPPGN